MKINRLAWALAKLIVFLSALVPLVWLVWAALAGRLGANPIEEITHQTGTWTLRLLLITLSVTPLRTVTRWNGWIRFRRMMGLFAFFYGILHLSTYLWLDQFFDWNSIVKDVVKRPFITAGFTSFVLLIPLAVTSTAGMVRRLGGRRWQQLHRLIYVSATGGVIHYWWLVKADVRLPMLYGAVVAVLLAFRVALYILRRRRAAEPVYGRPCTSPVSELTNE